MVHTLLAAAVAITFPGGNVSDLAKSIAESTKQNVVFQAGADERVKPFDYDPSDLNQFAKAVLDSTGFKRSPGATHVFHHGRLGSWLFGLDGVRRIFNDEAWTGGAAWPANALADGKVSLKTTAGQSALLASFPSEMLPKPIERHWLFERAAIKAWVSELPAQDFMNYIAKAVGGKLIQKTDRFVLDIDAAEIQRRAVATLAEAKKTPAFAKISAAQRGKIELSRAVLASVPTPQVAALLLAPQGRLRFEIGHGTRPAVQAYVQTLIQQSGSPQQEEELVAQVMIQRERGRGDRGEQRENRNLGMILRRADPRVIGFTTIDARFDVRVQLLTLDNYGRPGRLVDLP